MIFLRSLLFNMLFYAMIVAMMIVFSPYFFLAARKKAWFVPKFWASSNLWLQELIVGNRMEISGLEHRPSGSYIVAPKHQSFWDTFAFLPYIPDAVYILKRELMWIPLFGWYVAKMKMIPINRGNRSKALKGAIKEAQKLMTETDRQLIIYPEGTRREPGAEPKYKYGIVELYAQLGIPVLPIAHVAGLYWPRRKFMRYPGVTRARILPPIEPGLDREEFLKRLIDETEAACDELLIEAARSENPPRFPPSAADRLHQLGVELPRR
jgi:1-acyl-sn-glycerol-3-phosphate acyltransferase